MTKQDLIATLKQLLDGDDLPMSGRDAIELAIFLAEQLEE